MNKGDTIMSNKLKYLIFSEQDNMVAHGSPEDRMKGVTVHDSSIDSYKRIVKISGVSIRLSDVT